MCSATAVTTATLVVVFCLVTITARGEAVSELEWFACPEHSDLSCAYFKIPLDYHDSSVGKGRIAVVKANSTGTRQGTFFYNPGTFSAALTRPSCVLTRCHSDEQVDQAAQGSA